MIPFVIPPLTGISVLVTRPAAQAESLASAIRAQGGEAQVLPAIDIRPIAASTTGSYELIVFVSANAAEHGVAGLTRSPATKVAAIGKATAAALAAREWTADIVPDRGFTSEALLAHPDLALAAGSRILIVRGIGGREVLQQAFGSQGFAVDVLDVYERALPSVDTQRRDEIEAAWQSGEATAATATSVETLTNLMSLLSEPGRRALMRTTLVVPSPRVHEAALQLGFEGECLVAAGADDASIIGALSQWQSRARAET